MPEKRIQIKLKDPNPIFKKWLQKWYEEAKAKNSKSKGSYQMALRSLEKYPLELQSGKECAILHGFGATLCKMIDDELKNLVVQPPSTFDNDVREVIKKVGKQPASTKSKAAQKIVIQQSQPLEQLIMNAGSFRVILLVDTAETSGKSKKDFDDTRLFLDSFKVEYEVRRLSVGDFAWICRDSSGNELVIPYILERKRMDDLSSSVKDGRFHEQKHRLKGSGLKNILYLIEDKGSNERLGLPLPTLKQAAVNTQIHNHFGIKYTRNHKESMLYLSVLTKIFIKKYKDKVLMNTDREELANVNEEDDIVGMLSFYDFQNSSAKNKGMQIREVFIKQLIQLKLLSVEKAIAITEVYPTPRALLDAYEECESVEECEQLLEKITFGKLKRTIGSSISKVVYRFYSINF